MRVFAVLLTLPLLAGCSTDWDNLMNFGGSDSAQTLAEPAPAAPVPTQTAAAATPNALCLGVARKDATENGFDTATQQRVATRSYQQCAAIFGAQQ